MIGNWLLVWLAAASIFVKDSRPDLLQMARSQDIHELSASSTRVFFYTFARGGDVKKAVVVTAGNIFRTGIIKPDSARCVSLNAAMPFDHGDGAELTILLMNETHRSEAARIYLDPAHIRADRAWKPIRFEVPPGIDHFMLEFSVSAGPRGDYTSDWIGLAPGPAGDCLFAER
jgi:hypothetical protein